MGAGADLDPLIGLDDTSKPLRSKLLAVPSLRARYIAYVRDIAERWLDWDAVRPLVTKYQSLIADEVRLDTRKLYPFDLGRRHSELHRAADLSGNRRSGAQAAGRADARHDRRRQRHEPALSHTPSRA